MNSTSRRIIAGAVAAVWLSAAAQDVVRTPLRADHPLVGAWRVDVPGTGCHEVYTIRADGTTSVTSGAQAAESEFALDPTPSPKGFYRWVDKIVRDNGRPDCTGEVMEVGHVATNFIAVHPNGREFVMCRDESFEACIGPFRRLGSDV